MRKQLLILILSIMFCITACSQSSGAPTDEPPGQEEQKDEEPEQKDEEDEEDKDQTEDAQDDSQARDEDENKEEPSEPAAESTKITVYYGNDDAAAFETQEAEISSLTPEEVLDALIAAGAVSDEVKVLSFNKSTIDGKDTLVLDLNSAFSAYVLSMGTAGEYYAIGSVCNTFLDAYFGDQIKITVEGATLETGHADYPGYLTKFS